MGLLIESIAIEVLSILLLLFWALYWNVTKQFSYWKDRGVPHISPSFPFGSLKDVFLGRKHTGEVYQQFYKRFPNARYFGVHETRRPVLVVKDPDLINHILTKDFHHFTDRFVFPIDEKKNYINKHLFNLCGQQWKNMRMKLSPTFTSGKLKMMFFLMQKCGDQLSDQITSQLKHESVVDVKDVLTRFTMDIIATCAFGLEINSLSDKNCEFYQNRIKIFQPSIAIIINRNLFSVIPLLSKIMTMRFTPIEVSNFLTRIVRDTVKFREKNNINRNDFLDLLIKIKQNNKRSTEDGEQLNEYSGTKEKQPYNTTGLTLEEMTAQAFGFFAAGFETASSTMTFCLYELACNPKIQERLYQEVKEILKKHGGKPTYQALQETPYMDQVINETLRCYASLANLSRTCTETFKIPNSDLVIEKGQRIIIPICAIHHDPQYYPEPYKFDPERFTPEKVRERNPYLHLPFGEGPRMCIGMRFALLQTKIGLTQMLSSFQFGLSPKTKIPVLIHKRSFVTKPEVPILLNLTKRKNEL